MKISILTLFPEMFESVFNTSIIKRAIDNNLVDIECINIRDFTNDKHSHVDDTPFGGGKGMLIQCQPVLDALSIIRTKDSHVILMSPVGIKFNQKYARKFSNYKHLIIICGHYEGIDARVYKYVDELVSIGDYILTGGELGAMVISDAIIRLQTGVIEEESHQDESFENGLLEYPQYTKPQDYNGDLVPEVLLSGHHENIRKYRLKESLRLTKNNRPDLLIGRAFTDEELALLDEIENE
ncbi:MAG: tRNA (guanosine(37)-N1)-methyltransferase TrmD [Erysipelotrichaceae bacterium]|nr:tRNA (guanosine(37)-N1)-methyltransferase TrmD [Erysipelotrichaceae bacterium]